jgi:autotransporter-associated beta strand protein
MKLRIQSVARLSYPLALAMAAMLSAPAVRAGNTWDGGGVDNNWSTNANWDANTAPTYTTALTFTGGTRLSPNNDRTAASSIAGINFTNTATNAFTLTGNSATLGGNITTTAATSGTLTDTISMPLILAAARTITTNANHNLTISGNITETAASGISKAGAGTLTLSGSNTLSGNIAITAGVLVQNSAGALGGTNGVTISGNGILGLTSNFSRAQGSSGSIAASGRIYFNSNGGFAAYGADCTVNFGGANAQQTWFNGKNLILGTAAATHKVTITNPITITTVTRPLQVDDGPAAIEGEFSGVISHNTGAFAGVDKTGAGTVAFTGDSSFFGSLVVRDGTIVINKVTNAGTVSPIGQGTSGFTLAGGTFRYAPVNATGGGAATINRTFGIVASSSLDASGTGALVLNNTAVISPDVTGQTGTWPVGANQNITGLASTANLAIGMRVTGAGIPAGAVITQILSSTSITMSGTTTGHVWLPNQPHTHANRHEYGCQYDCRYSSRFVRHQRRSSFSRQDGCRQLDTLRPQLIHGKCHGQQWHSGRWRFRQRRQLGSRRSPQRENHHSQHRWHAAV